MQEYDRTGVLTEDDLDLPSEKQLHKGVAVIECIQKIPCNPCVDICPTDAISMENINAPPRVDFEACIGCGKCVAICPGLACFVIKLEDDHALVTLPYEMLPLPGESDTVAALNRRGEKIGEAIVHSVKKDDTPAITVEVAPELAMQVRAVEVEP